ncbi:unnamed protein product, partial [Arctogadus glacialis]
MKYNQASFKGHFQAQRIAPGQWRTKHGRDFEGFPCQTTGNYCGVLILMYAFCTCTDAPFLFTE